MKLFKRFVSSRDFWPLVAVLFFGILASRHLFTPGYFNMHDDLQVMRTLEMEKCFKRFGGVLSAIFYIWAPYHAVDVYVRGAMNEAWALVFFPAIFYFSYKLINN